MSAYTRTSSTKKHAEDPTFKARQAAYQKKYRDRKRAQHAAGWLARQTANRRARKAAKPVDGQKALALRKGKVPHKRTVARKYSHVEAQERCKVKQHKDRALGLMCPSPVRLTRTRSISRRRGLLARCAASRGS